MSLTASSLAPMYLLRSSGPCSMQVPHMPSVIASLCMHEKFPRTLMLTKFRLNSFATAPASRVFPVPGAPYSSNPHRCLMVHWLNSLGYCGIQDTNGQTECRLLRSVDQLTISHCSSHYFLLFFFLLKLSIPPLWVWLHKLNWLFLDGPVNTILLYMLYRWIP